MNDLCHSYRHDPESVPDHLERCDECAVEFERSESFIPALEAVRLHEVDESGLDPAALPVAPWEGAGRRPWSFVLTIAVAVTSLAATLFLLVDVSPLRGFAGVLRSTLAPRLDVIDLGFSFSRVLEEAPPLFHILVFASFVIVNLVLIALLRRAPRGYDVRSR